MVVRELQSPACPVGTLRSLSLKIYALSRCLHRFQSKCFIFNPVPCPGSPAERQAMPGQGPAVGSFVDRA